MRAEKLQNLTRFARLCVKLTVLGLFIIGGIFLNSFYSTIQESKTVVEPYCSIKYQHDVDGYKQCTKLDTKQLVIKLTQQEKEHQNFDVASLPIIGM